MLIPGASFPHMSIPRIDGTVFAYGDVWQQRNLVLVSLPADEARQESGQRYAAGLAAQAGVFDECEAVLVVTDTPVDGVPVPGVVVADRWGEVTAIAAAQDVASLPGVEQVLTWLRAVVHACPECEGEVR